MVEEATLHLLKLRENTSFTMLWHLEVSIVEDSLNSVLVYLKELDGLLLIIVMLSLSSMKRVQDAHSLLLNAASGTPSLTNTVLEVTEDALQLVEVVVLAKVILLLRVADTTILLKE
jgi:hypothetical protein